MNVEELDHSFMADRNIKQKTHFLFSGNPFSVFWKTEMSYRAMESPGGNLNAFY